MDYTPYVRTIGAIATNPFAKYWLDFKHNAIVCGLIYQISPNGYWAFTDNFSNYMQKYYFIKDRKTGAITRFEINNRTSDIFWDAQNRLIYCKYSVKDRQNVIYAYDPAAKTIKKNL